MPARGQYRVHRAKGRQVEYDETRRYEHSGYIESPAKLAKAFEEAVERNKLKLAEQRKVASSRPGASWKSA